MIQRTVASLIIESFGDMPGSGIVFCPSQREADELVSCCRVLIGLSGVEYFSESRSYVISFGKSHLRFAVTSPLDSDYIDPMFRHSGRDFRWIHDRVGLSGGALGYMKTRLRSWDSDIDPVWVDVDFVAED